MEDMTKYSYTIHNKIQDMTKYIKQFFLKKRTNRKTNSLF